MNRYKIIRICRERSMEMNNNEEEEIKSGISPFVMKTYQLVSNPSTDSVVGWGINNTTFIIVDPMCFSQRILPAYFKHNNFSSFVRQLNTYGFRKVDPDRWEFANQWFLRGQEHLLCNITRKKYNKNVTYKRELEMDEHQLRGEVLRLKEEQRHLEEELHRMSRRIEAAERRPEQMMTLLYKVVQDPQQAHQLLLNGTLLDKGNEELGVLGEEKKKRRTVKASGSSSNSTSCSYNSSSMAVSSSNRSEELEDDWAIGGSGGSGVINYSSKTTNDDDKLVYCDHGFDNNNNVVVFDDSFYCDHGFPKISYDNKVAETPAEVAVDGSHTSPPRRQIPYPFSLLEGGF